MIEVHELWKTYGSGPLAFHALKGVSLTASAGEVLLLVGPSGSGKTTLLSILGCVLSPTSGSVKLAGRELAGLPETKLPEMRRQFRALQRQLDELRGESDSRRAPRTEDKAA